MFSQAKIETIVEMMPEGWLLFFFYIIPELKLFYWLKQKSKSRFTTETKRKPGWNQVLVVLFTSIDSSVCLAANNNVGSKMFNKNAIFVSYQLPLILWIFILREMNVETWEIKIEVNIINLDQSLILMFFFCFCY